MHVYLTYRLNNLFDNCNCFNMHVYARNDRNSKINTCTCTWCIYIFMLGFKNCYCRVRKLRNIYFPRCIYQCLCMSEYRRLLLPPHMLYHLWIITMSTLRCWMQPWWSWRFPGIMRESPCRYTWQISSYARVATL